MTRTMFCLICIFVGATFSFSVQAQESNLTKDFGIGLQGATPELVGSVFATPDSHRYIFKPLDVLFSRMRTATTC